MKVGILSDTHNEAQPLQTILNHFRSTGINTVYHCGDVTSPDMIRYFYGFSVHLAFGNGDYLNGSLKEALILLGTGSTAKRLNAFSVDNKQILLVHGNFEKEYQLLAGSHKYDIVFTGHTHERMNRWNGETHIINPGAASRAGAPSYSYAIFDFEITSLDFFQIS
jgi:putative phosphoesterase